MFIATVPPGHRQLRRSGMFIGIATNNGLRKLRQERHLKVNCWGSLACECQEKRSANVTSATPPHLSSTRDQKQMFLRPRI